MNVPLDLVYIADKYPQVANLVASYDAACDRAEAAEARAAELEIQRDRAAYEATMTAARVVYDLAVKSKIDGRIDDYSAQIMAFNAICLSSGIR